MNKTITIVIGLGILLLFTGCTEPQLSVNQNNKKLTFVKGKPYAIPVNTISGKRLISAKQIKNARLIGAYCKKGDISWISNGVSSLFDKYDGKTAGEIIRRDHLAGCASPLSKQEYEYRLNQQNQQQANNRAYINYQTATATKKVDYTGTVYHY